MAAQAPDIAEQGQPLLQHFEIEEASDPETPDTPNSIQYGAEKYASLVQTVQKHVPTIYTLATLPLLIFPRWMLPSNGNQPKVHVTSWLDALRGYAAMSVVFSHKFAFEELSIWELPFFNAISRGSSAVDMFFVISGYVLTQRMLLHARARRKEILADSLTAALFRRWLRLFAPCAVATFVTIPFVHWGLMSGPRVDTFLGQVVDWIIGFAKFSNPLTPIMGWHTPAGINIKYNTFLWTIPVEYRGSLVAFVFIASTFKLRSLHRLLIGACLAIFFFTMQDVHGSLFLTGTLLAEISLIRFPERYESKTLPSQQGTETESTNEAVKTKPSVVWCVVYGLTFAFGVFLFGNYGHPENWHPAYSFLEPLTPKPSKTIKRGFVRSFWPSIAAFLIIWSVDSWEILQMPFNLRFSQLLGELSFGIYVMQKFVFDLLYDPILLPLFEKHFPSGGMWVLGGLILTVVEVVSVLWVADWFARVDKQIVRATRALQTRLFLDW